jgi:hypothetical protein
MLTLIEKHIPVVQESAKPSSYADAARQPPPASQAPPEKFISSRVLREVTVQPLAEPEPTQASERIVKAINRARAFLSEKVVAARRLRSGDVLVTADSHSTKNNLEEETGWTTVIAKCARVKGKMFTVMAHAVRTSRVDPAEQDKSLSDLEAQNPNWEGEVIILHVAWRMKTLKEGKSHGPLLLEVGTPSKANMLVQEGLLHDGELKDCKLFHGDCNLTQCFRCQRYRHIAKRCQDKLACGFCAKEPETRSCPSYNSRQVFSCSNCKGKHPTWSRLCPDKQAMASKAVAAYAARPLLYKTPAKSSLSCFSPSPQVSTPPPSTLPQAILQPQTKLSSIDLPPSQKKEHNETMPTPLLPLPRSSAARPFLAAMTTPPAYHPPLPPLELKKGNLAHLPMAIPRVPVPFSVTLASLLPMQQLPLLMMNYDGKTQHSSIQYA